MLATGGTSLALVQFSDSCVLRFTLAKCDARQRDEEFFLLIGTIIF